jgi:hypothetical protein
VCEVCKQRNEGGEVRVGCTAGTMKASNGREGRLVCGCTGQELLRSGGVLSLPGKCHCHCNCRCQASEKLKIRKEREETMYAL